MYEEFPLNTRMPTQYTDKIALATKIPYVQLLNDFEAIGYGLSKLGPSDVIALNPKVHR